MNPLITSGADAVRERTALSVNLNKVALLRNTRHLGIPSVTRAATRVLEAGAHGITVHPRPDERHIRRYDVFDLADLLQAWPAVEYNIEGNPLHNLMGLVRELAAQGRCPHQVTFVPDSVEQATSDHGWQFPQDAAVLAPLVQEARALGARVSLFMDPCLRPWRLRRRSVPTASSSTPKPYARAHGTPRQAEVLASYTAAAVAALRAGLGLNAGHDLNRENLGDFLRAVPGVQEVSIGHALIADALELGLAETVRDYQRCIHLAGR